MDNNKLKLIVFDIGFNILSADIYWDLDKLRDRLITKLSYMAIIKGYPYKRSNETYYKYTNLNIYKLIGFNVFLELLKKDKIFIAFNTDIYLKGERYGNIKDRGTAFRLHLDSINDLFEIVG